MCMSPIIHRRPISGFMYEYLKPRIEKLKFSPLEHDFKGCYNIYVRYQKIVRGKFIRRPNRFIAEVEIDGSIETVHVKNTGRLGEILKEDVTVYMEDFEGRMGSRKMRYSLVAAEKEVAPEVAQKIFAQDTADKEGVAIPPATAETTLAPNTMTVNVDSQAPNKVVLEALKEGRIRLEGLDELKLIRPETKYGDSRFDFYLEDMSGRRAFAEVKGVTLEFDGHASFPDAPTERGARHLRELMKAKAEGYLAYVIFVIQMKPMLDFSPNEEHDPVFSRALREADKSGVRIVAYDCKVTADSLVTDTQIKIVL